MLANVRLRARSAQDIARFLVNRAYEPEISHNGVAHLFRRNGVDEIDLFVPDGLGRRARLTTVRPNRTIAIPGGTRALERSHVVDARSRDVSGQVPRPDLLGAIVVKARAIEVDDVPNAQRADVALLLSLVEDPDTLAQDLTRSDHRILSKHAYFADPARPEWDGFAADDPEASALVFRRLIG